MYSFSYFLLNFISFKFYFILQLLFVSFFFEIKLLAKTNLCRELFSNSYYYFWIVINDNKKTRDNKDINILFNCFQFYKMWKK